MLLAKDPFHFMEWLTSHQGQSTMVSVGFVLFVTGFMYLVDKRLRSADSSIMAYLRDQFKNEHAVWLMIGIISLSVLEGLMAATITPSEEEYLNPVVRLIVHIVTTLMSVLIIMQLPPALLKLIELKELRKIADQKLTDKKITKEQHVKIMSRLTIQKWFYRVGVFPILIVAGFTLPYMNLLVIGIGLDKVSYISYFFYELNPLVTMKGSDIYKEILYNEGFRGRMLEKELAEFSIFRLGRLGITGFASIIVCIAHYLLTAVEAVLTTITIEDRDTKLLLGLAEDNTNKVKVNDYLGNKEKSKKNRDKIDKLRSSFYRMVKFYDPPGMDWTDETDKAMKQYLSLNNQPKAQAVLSNKAAEIVNKMNDFADNIQNNNFSTEEDRDRAEEKVNRAILDLFNTKIEQGGLESPLFSG